MAETAEWQGRAVAGRAALTAGTPAACAADATGTAGTAVGRAYV
jgi:hypothetical protein